MTDMQQLDRDSGEASEAKLNRLRELAEQATPGPWQLDDTSDTTRDIVEAWDDPKWPGTGWFRNGPGKVDIGDYSTLSLPDAAYIAAASPDVILALLSERDRMDRLLLQWADRDALLSERQANQERIAELLTLMDEHDEKARHGMCGDIGPKARSLLSSSGGDDEG